MQFIILLLALTVASGYLDVAVGSNVGKRDAADADMVMTRENATVSSAPKINIGATKSDAKVQGVVPADAGDAKSLAGAQRAKGAKGIKGGQNKIFSNKAVAGSDSTLAGTNSTVARGKGKAGVEKVNVEAVTGDQAQDAPVLDQQAAGGNRNNAGDNGKDSRGNGKNAEGNGKNPDGNGKNTGGKTQNAAVAGAGAGATTLNPKAIQSGSATDDSVGAAAGQVKSLTDAANFVNFCVEKSSQKGILTNGLQVKAGSCNGIRESCQEHFYHLI